MGLKDDLSTEVAAIFRSQWAKRDGTVVPEPDSLTLGNTAVLLDAVILYADMNDSTALVDTYDPTFAAEIYKVYLLCGGKIVRDNGGQITAYDGDRIMAVFIGSSKNTSAVKAALMINYACNEIITPAMKTQYPTGTFRLKHSVGVDASKVFVTRTGVWGANDLVWVGKAANHAAKLSALATEYSLRITKEVYDMADNSVKYYGNQQPLWAAFTWNAMSRGIYQSNGYWTF